MATLTMTRPNPVRMTPDASPQEIIAAARAAPTTAFAAPIAAAVTAILMWGAFTPLDWGPLGWICLIPLLRLARSTRSAPYLYRSLYAGGLLFWILTLQWMRLGDPTMYGAWILLSLYLAVYYPVFIGLTRLAVHRLNVPLIAAAPVLWTGLEMLKAHLMTGFGWYNLGHSQYRWLEVIQICDLVGVYGVSFVMALTAAGVVALLPDGFFRTLRMTTIGEQPPTVRPVLQLVVCLSAFMLVLGYGYVRRGQADFQPGPRVALIQGNFTATARPDPKDIHRVFARYHALTGAAIPQQPDLVVWPEGMFPYPLLKKPDDVSIETLDARYPELRVDQIDKSKVPQMLRQLSEKGGAAFIFGLQTLEVDDEGYRVYNSAVMAKQTGISGRYDKIHRVIFGEYIPLAEWFPFLQGLTPYRGGFGIAEGKHSVAFEFKPTASRDAPTGDAPPLPTYRAVPVICYEDSIPHLVRSMISATRQADDNGRLKKADMLVSVSNDGWFHGSSEHDQHLIIAAFRCVELRMPMVRAVNTGVSAVIDGDGHIRDRAKNEKTGKSKLDEAVLVATVPLDHRSSFYLRCGDWFGATCLAGCFACGAFGLFDRFRRKPIGSVLS